MSAHVIFWSLVTRQPTKARQSTTMTLSLAQSQASHTQPYINNHDKAPNPASSASTSTSIANNKDIRDDSLPWKQHTSDAFRELNRQSADKPNLSWIDNMFSQNNTQRSDAGNTSKNISDEQQIRDLLKSIPSTQSEFWPYLVKHLANNKYHDKQYPFSELKSERIVVLKLGFQSNGMLVRANIARSSGDPELDAAAIRSAYAANPFEPPPSSDRVFDYNYLVQIIYSPKKLASDG